MCLQDAGIPGNGTVVIVVDPHIQQHVQDECKIEKRKVKTIAFFPYLVLHPHFYTKEPEWFDQQVQKDQQRQVGKEVFFQRRIKYFYNQYKCNKFAA